MNSENIKKILVIRFSSLGDIILTTPLIKLLKASFPGSEIHYLTKKMYSGVLKYNPHIKTIIDADDNADFAELKNLKSGIKNNNYDLIVDAHNNLKTFYLKLFLKAKKLTFKKYSFRKFLLVNFKINLMKNLTPITVRYCDIISSLTAKRLNNHRPEIFTNSLSDQNANKGLMYSIHEDKKITIGIVPSSNHFTKTYPAEKYIELINSFDSNKYKFLLFGKGNDRKNIELIVSQTGGNVTNLCDILNINELAETMEKCSLIISGDTGPMHIAESLNIPLVMLAGSSVKEFGFYPQSQNALVMERDGLSCRPCSHIGRSYCPKDHFKCMNDLTPAAVSAKMLELLN